MLTMVDKDGNVIGTTGYPRIYSYDNKAEFGIIIHHPYWGNGYSTEAHLLGLELGFETLKFHRIEFVTGEKNKPMRSFFENFGIKLEGIMRESNLQLGEYTSNCLYSILIHEWPLVKEKMIAHLNKQK